jgi:ApbE superfamily uncharacterized protein (UPF0280 family)
MKYRYKIGESRGIIICDNLKGIKAAINSIRENRIALKKYIMKNPIFEIALNPIELEDNAPIVAKKMVEVTKKLGIGPMAAVAGVLADLALEAAMNENSKYILIENGGEIAINGDHEFKVGIKVGDSIILRLKIRPCDMPIGIATSSGKYGHALSFGIADSVTIIADNASIADAVATAVCNSTIGKNPLENGLLKAKEIAKSIKEVRGAIIIVNEEIGIYGKIPEII